MANVDVPNPRLPQFGQAAGLNGGISADVYEQFAPQMATTAFKQADMGRSYQLDKDIFEEGQAQLDAKIAQSKEAEALRQIGIKKEQKKAKTGRKVSAAATGATLGAQAGSVIPGVGNVVGGVIGGLGGLIFGNEGGYVPEIHPRSMLYKEYQQGGTVTGYTGEGKFGRRGLQNLQMRQDDISRLSSNVDKMGKYGFWDAAMDVGKGYMMGKNISDLASGVMKSDFVKGLPDAFEAGGVQGMSKAESLLDYTKSFMPQGFGGTQSTGMTDFFDLFKNTGAQASRVPIDSLSALSQLDSNTVKKSPVRDTVLGLSPFKKEFRKARDAGKKAFEYDGKMFNTRLS